MSTPTIKTTGQLRAFLTDSLSELREGKLSVERANQMTRMAAQINESFYSEVKVSRLQKDFGRVSESMGQLVIGGEK